MSETTMPVAEVAAVGTDTDINSYELAFHVLPTVTEGEVASIFSAIKEHIQTVGGTITTEEAPGRVDLAYEVVKHLEGKNRKFKSAYFGWVRFESVSSTVEDIMKMMDANTNILRQLLIKLTRQEALQPFFYHEAMKEAGTVVTNFDEDDAEAADSEAVNEEVETTSEDADTNDVTADEENA